MKDDERGLALLVVVFVITLATVLVLDLLQGGRFDQRAARAFTESVQADFVLKSALNLGRILIELPKQDGISEDWLGDPWALISAAPSLPIAGVVGNPRMSIVDEDGKIGLNLILESATPNTTIPGITGQRPSGAGGGARAGAASFWKTALRELFSRDGVAFSTQDFESETFRTRGNVGYDANRQVALIHDWIDFDTRSHSSPFFDGEGAEGSLPKELFFNRPLRTLSEALLVPGMTLDRLSRIAPFVRVSPIRSGRTRQINVNTAPYEVLVAMGFPETQATEMIQERTNLPIDRGILRNLVQGNSQLTRYTNVRSTEFSIFARVVMPNVTRWLRVVVTTTGSVRSRRTNVRLFEVY